MLYALKLEAIGDNVTYEKRMHRRHGLLWEPKRRIEQSVKQPWVARITGRDLRYGLRREFVTGRRDYTHANSCGSRGIWVHYLLEDGLYEVNEPVKWDECRRYYLCVVGGNGRELTLKEVAACLN